MEQERKIKKWDRRRVNKRLQRLQKKEKYKNTIQSVDKVNIDLPELNEKQEKNLRADIDRIKNAVEV